MRKSLLPIVLIAVGCAKSAPRQATLPLDPPAGSELVQDAPVDTGGGLVAPERVPVEAPEAPLATYALRRGETLHHFARWTGLPIEQIAESSGLSPLDDSLPVGTAIRIPLDPDAREQLDARREAHHARRAADWLDSHGGEAGTESYRVRTGDSAWSIAHTHGAMPVWVIETYNPAVDLDRLRPGQDLVLPVVASRLASDDQP